MSTYEDFATATAWRPEKAGDRVSGFVVGFTVYEHAEYGKSPVVFVGNDESGTLTAVYAIHGVMLNRLIELSPQVGEKLTIIYTGTHTSRQRKDKSGDPVVYSGYIVYTGEGDVSQFSSLDWSLFR